MWAKSALGWAHFLQMQRQWEQFFSCNIDIDTEAMSAGGALNINQIANLVDIMVGY